MASTHCAFDGDPNQACSAEEPVRHRVGDPENRHWVRCHLYRPRAGAGGHALATDHRTGHRRTLEKRLPHD